MNSPEVKRSALRCILPRSQVSLETSYTYVKGKLLVVDKLYVVVNVDGMFVHVAIADVMDIHLL